MKAAAYVLLLVLVTAIAHRSYAADPPDTLNYQGALRDSNDVPINGTVAMVFRLFGAASGGDAILVDSHASVPVDSGLFNVRIGEGNVTDGPGSGVFLSLLRAIGETAPLYLEVEINGETLSPRTEIASSAYALNARRVRGTEIVTTGPLDLFVDGGSGNDANDGLSAATSKQTIGSAVRSIPIVLNGNVTVRIQPGVYREEIVLSGRQRNGLYTVVLQQDTDNPAGDVPSVVVRPPNPCNECAGFGFLVLDELVRIIGIQVDGFNFPEVPVAPGLECTVNGDGDGIVASGSTNLTMINVALTNNRNGIFGTDGHFVEFESGGRIEGNCQGIRASDHGSFEVNGPFYSCDNVQAAVAARNSWIRFEGSCTFCGTDGPMFAELFSSISLDGSCTNWPGCTNTAEGKCP